MFKQIDHVGAVVKNIEESVKMYEKSLGIKPWKNGIQENKETGQKMAILPIPGTFLELIQPPTKTENRFNRLLKERGEGIGWICFHEDDYDARVATLKTNGFPVEEDMPTAFPGHKFRVAWVPPQAAGGFWLEFADKKALPDFLIKHEF
jgi:methylmalonyl-CoA/ethylmalonyl-CoA epimerase